MSTTKPKPFDPGFTARDFAVLAAALREEITAADRIRRRKLTLPLREVIPASFTGRPWVWALLTVAQLPAVTGWGKATLEDYLKGQAAVPFPPHTAEIGRRGNLYAAGDVACFAAQLAPAMRHDRGLNLEQREEIRRLRATGMGPARSRPCSASRTPTPCTTSCTAGAATPMTCRLLRRSYRGHRRAGGPPRKRGSSAGWRWSTCSGTSSAPTRAP